MLLTSEANWNKAAGCWIKKLVDWRTKKSWMTFPWVNLNEICLKLVKKINSAKHLKRYRVALMILKSMINYTELAISHLQLQTQKFMCFFLDLINIEQVVCHEN